PIHIYCISRLYYFIYHFLFTDIAPTEIYTLSLHDALPILPVTSNTSERLTTPVMIATTAPIKAVIPISKPFGCQITKVKVKRKITIAKIVINSHLISHFYIHIFD